MTKEKKIDQKKRKENEKKMKKEKEKMHKKKQFCMTHADEGDKEGTSWIHTS